MSDPKPNRVLLGRIGPAHGIRGEVVVQSFAADPADVDAYGPLSDEAGTRSYTLKVLRVTPKGVVARIDGIGDRTGAEKLRGIDLFVARDLLPEPDEGEFYHSDLVGLAAVSPEGIEIGAIISVQNFGAGDLLEIRLADTRNTAFVAFRDEFVPEVDIKGGRVVVRLPVDAPDEEAEDQRERDAFGETQVDPERPD